MNDSLRTGTKLLTAAFIVGIVSAVLLLSVPLSMMFFDGGMRFLIARSYVQLALSVTAAGLLIGGWSVLRPLASERALPFLNAAIAFPVLRLVLTVVTRASRLLPSRGLAMSLLWTFVFLGGLLATWLALRTLSADRVPKPPDATPLVITGLLLLLLTTVAQEWDMAHERFLLTGHLYLWLSVVDFVAGMLIYGVFLSHTRALATSVLPSEAPAVAAGGFTPTFAPPSAPSSSNDLVIGSIWLVGGLIVTGVSVSMAQSGGGHYVVTTGAIVFGLVRIVRGLTRR